MIRTGKYNSRLEALLQGRADALDSAWASFAVTSGKTVTERDSEIVPTRDHTTQHRNYSLDQEVLGTLVETEILAAAERIHVSTSQGTWFEIFEDGTIQVHSKKDYISVVQGDRLLATNGDKSEGVTGNSVLQVNGSIIVTRGGTTVTVSASAVSIVTDVNCTVDSPNVTITGGELNVEGQSNLNVSGPFCGLTNCLFTGAPHRGSKVSGT